MKPRDLPSVHVLAGELDDPLAVEAARTVLARARAEIRAGREPGDIRSRLREVLVSRGELIEIGEGFRIPDVLARSGARMVEVGTTNRTRAADYVQAAGPETAVILRVHQSNFRVVGFAERAGLHELAAVAKQ